MKKYGGWQTNPTQAWLHMKATVLMVFILLREIGTTTAEHKTMTFMWLLTLYRFQVRKTKIPIMQICLFMGLSNWQLDYLGVKNVLFKCDWVDDIGVNVDELGFTVVNLDRIGYKYDCFILAGHAKQVFYVKDQLDNSKSVVC